MNINYYYHDSKFYFDNYFISVYCAHHYLKATTLSVYWAR